MIAHGEYRMRCAAVGCDSEYVESFAQPFHMEVLRPCLPPEWLELDGLGYCSKHHLKIVVDDRTVLDVPPRATTPLPE